MTKKDSELDLAAPDLGNKAVDAQGTESEAAPDLKVEPKVKGKTELVNVLENGHIFASCGKVAPGARFTVPAAEAQKYIKARAAKRYDQWVEENES